MRLDAYEDYLAQTRIPVRLACNTEAGWPIVLSLWYLYRDGVLYCATQANAKIVEHLRADPRCAYEVAADLPPYCGIRGRGRAEIVSNLGGETLNLLLQRYLGGVDSSLAIGLLAKINTEVAIRINPETVYAWNFTERMGHGETEIEPKVCPDVG